MFTIDNVSVTYKLVKYNFFTYLQQNKTNDNSYINITITKIICTLVKM